MLKYKICLENHNKQMEYQKVCQLSEARHPCARSTFASKPQLNHRLKKSNPERRNKNEIESVPGNSASVDGVRRYWPKELSCHKIHN